jgi:hypothetical protein
MTLVGQNRLSNELSSDGTSAADETSARRSPRVSPRTGHRSPATDSPANPLGVSKKRVNRSDCVRMSLACSSACAPCFWNYHQNAFFVISNMILDGLLLIPALRFHVRENVCLSAVCLLKCIKTRIHVERRSVLPSTSKDCFCWFAGHHSCLHEASTRMQNWNEHSCLKHADVYSCRNASTTH